MILYLDTSAFVRLYIQEEHHDLVLSTLQSARQIAAHLITYAEMRAAFARMHRMQRLGQKEVTTVKKAFEADWRNTLQITPTETMVRRAGDLAEQFELRGYDSVHLAAGESLMIDRHYPIHFASFDTALNAAAAVLGMHTIVTA